MYVSASGYSAYDPGNSKHTASGTLVRRGVIAVDPNVIPLGTHVFIPGYGDAVAEVLVCASCFVSSNCETLILQPLASFPFTIQSFIALVVKTASPLVCRDIFPFPGPPLLSWGLRAPPAFG